MLGMIGKLVGKISNKLGYRPARSPDKADIYRPLSAEESNGSEELLDAFGENFPVFSEVKKLAGVPGRNKEWDEEDTEKIVLKKHEQEIITLEEEEKIKESIYASNSEAAKEQSDAAIRRAGKRKCLSLKKILKSDFGSDKVGKLYEMALSDSTDFEDLNSGIALLEKMVDNIPPLIVEVRKDLITLESVLRAKNAYQTGRRVNILGEKLEGGDYSRYLGFKDFLLREVLENAESIDEKDKYSPLASEEGTFHISSIRKYLKK